MTEPDPIAELAVLIKLANGIIERHQTAIALASIDRAHLIQQLHQAGLNCAEIGRACGLSRSRVHQIVYPKGKNNP